MEQKKKNIALLISLGILCLISLTLFLGGKENRIEIDPNLFQLTEPKAIDRITIAKAEKKIELKFSSSQWRVNETWPADRDLIDVLFATIDQAIPKRKVASRVMDSVRNLISGSGIKVTFFEGLEKQKEFVVLGDAESGSTYFSDPEDVDLYAMVIPGYRVYVAGIFEQDANAWRDKRIFNFNWRNFKELRAEFPDDPTQNFTVAMTGRFFSLVGQNNIDTTSLNNYLDAVSLIKADSFYFAIPMMDSIATPPSIMSILVKDVADQLYSLTIFEIGKEKRNVLARWNEDFVWLDRKNIIQLYKMKKDFAK